MNNETEDDLHEKKFQLICTIMGILDHFLKDDLKSYIDVCVSAVCLSSASLIYHDKLDKNTLINRFKQELDDHINIIKRKHEKQS